MNKNIIGLGILGLTAYAIFKPTKEQEEISTKSNPRKVTPSSTYVPRENTKFVKLMPNKDEAYALFEIWLIASDGWKKAAKDLDIGGGTDSDIAQAFNYFLRQSQGEKPQKPESRHVQYIITYLERMNFKPEVIIKRNPAKRWKHSVPAKCLPTVIASLAYLKSHPKKIDKISAKDMKYLVSEEWFDVENAELTDLGNEFLENITAESED